MTFGLVAVATIAESAYRICRGIEVWNDPEHGPRGLGGSWKRLLATTWLMYLLCFGWMVVMAFALVGGMMAIRSPMAGVGGAALGFVAVLSGGVIVAAVVTGLWFVCRWIFATTICVVRPAMGFSAFKMSADFERGRVLRCVLFFILMALVALGLQMPLALTRYHILREVAPVDWRWCVQAVVAGVALDFACLFCVVALMVFWRRTEDAEDGVVALPPPRRNKVLVFLLMVAGVAFLAWLLMVGCEHVQKARAEQKKQQETLQQKIRDIEKELSVKASKPQGE